MLAAVLPLDLNIYTAISTATVRTTMLQAYEDFTMVLNWLFANKHGKFGRIIWEITTSV
jgi:hypothetical protein